MDGLLHPEKTQDFPALRRWLEHAEVTRSVVTALYPSKTEEELLSVSIQENVLAQMENLRTHPSIAAALAIGQVRIHGWVYKIETGEIFGYQPEKRQFISIGIQEIKIDAPSRRPQEVVAI